MLLIVAGTFVATFLIVCVIAYVLLSRRSVDPNRASHSRSEAGNVSARMSRRREAGARPDDDVKLALHKVTRIIEWFQHGSGANQAPSNALPPSAHGVPGSRVKVVLLVCAMLVLAVAAFYAVIAVFLQLGNWFLEPVIGYAFDLILPFLLVPEGTLFLAGVVLILGLPLSRRFRRPDRFCAGVVAIALALATFWPMQHVAASVELGFREYNVILHGLALFISLSLLTGGLEAIRRACNTPKDDSWEFLR
jgi:hypothetical protein